jgi:hypothetical protein
MYSKDFQLEIGQEQAEKIFIRDGIQYSLWEAFGTGFQNEYRYDGTPEETCVLDMNQQEAQEYVVEQTEWFLCHDQTQNVVFLYGCNQIGGFGYAWEEIDTTPVLFADFPSLEKSVKTAQLLSAISDNQIIDSSYMQIDSDGDGELTIEYAFSLEYAYEVLGYNKEEFGEDAPETWQVEAKIQISLEDWKIADLDRTGKVFDCKYTRQQGGGIEGYEFDHFGKIGDEIIHYLEEFIENLSDVEFKGTTIEENFEVFFDGQTAPNDAYRNNYVKMATRDGSIFFHESNNHLAHNHNDLIGQCPWTRSDKYYGGSEAFLSRWEENFPTIWDEYRKKLSELE